MEEHLPPTPGDRGSSEPLVRHVTQAHPNDLVDPWWMDQALSRDYGEFIYRQWSSEMSGASVLRTPLGWWEEEDSNLRRHRRRFYRPLPLAARASSREPTG